METSTVHFKWLGTYLNHKVLKTLSFQKLNEKLCWFIPNQHYGARLSDSNPKPMEISPEKPLVHRYTMQFLILGNYIVFRILNLRTPNWLGKRRDTLKNVKRCLL